MFIILFWFFLQGIVIAGLLYDRFVFSIEHSKIMEMEGAFSDLQSICFTCLSSENSLVSVTEENADYEEFLYMYENLTSISLTNNNQLSGNRIEWLCSWDLDFSICLVTDKKYQETTSELFEEVKEVETSIVMCEACIQKLNDSFNFREMCRESYKSLQKLRSKDLEIKSIFQNVREATFPCTSKNNCFEVSERLENSEINEKSEINQTDTSSFVEKDSLSSQNCNICHTTFETREEYKKHCSISHSDGYKCGICDISFRLPELLADHIIDTHQKDKSELTTKFKCSRCKTIYTSINSLKTHLLYSHIGTRQRFSCKYCKKEFNDIHNLYEHEIIHTSQSREVCQHCGKSFKSAVTLHRHMWCHADKKPFSCNNCSNTFVTKTDLKIHMRSHTDERPFPCLECHKKFKRNAHLVTHMRTHTGEKPYTCLYCNRAFAQSGDLLSHQRIHTGERPYRCQYCEKTFNQSSGLTIHLRKHMGSEDLICSVCSAQFSSPRLLLNHTCLK